MLHSRFKEQEREEFELLGPPHPGEVLREEVLPRLKISRKALALQLGVSYSTVSRLLNARRRIAGDLAVRLAQISGTSALYWLVLQAHHDAWLVQGPTRRRAFKSRETVEQEMSNCTANDFREIFKRRNTSSQRTSPGCGGPRSSNSSRSCSLNRQFSMAQKSCLFPHLFLSYCHIFVIWKSIPD